MNEKNIFKILLIRIFLNKKLKKQVLYITSTEDKKKIYYCY